MKYTALTWDSPLMEDASSPDPEPAARVARFRGLCGTITRQRAEGWRPEDIEASALKAGYGADDVALAMQDESLDEVLPEHGGASDLPAIIDAQDWIQSEPEPTDPIFCGLFDTGDKCALIGSSKMRKSFFALQLACSVAAGSEFLGWQPQRPRRVLLVQLEVRARHFHRRLRRMVRALGVDVGNRLKILNGRGINLNIETITQIALSIGAEFVLLDPLYKLLDGDENLARDVKPTLRMFDEMAEVTGAAIMYVHHDAKGAVSERNIRDRGAGSNIVGRDYDACITLTPHRDGDDAAVVGVLLRNHPPVADFSIGWTEAGCFQVQENRPALPAKTGGRQNPTSARPTAEYIPDLQRIVSDRVITKGELVQELRDDVGLTRDKAAALVEKGETEGIIERWDKCYPKRVFFGTPEAVLRHAEHYANPPLFDEPEDKGGDNAA